MRDAGERTTAANRIVWILLGIAYLTVWLVFDRLTFPIQRDELHFWPTALRFSERPIPTLAFLRDYGEMNTPLPFLMWGWLERLFHGGIVAGRHLNFILSFVMALVVAWGRRGHERHAALCAVGLLACPYYLGTSTVLYTDIIAALFALGGVAFHLQRRHLLSAIAFALGIASRQVIVAFPLALAVDELLQARSRTVRRAGVIAPLLAASSLIAWVLLFGGFGPPSEVGAQADLIAEPFALHPEHALLFLATIGVYFVVPELLLFRHEGGAAAQFRRPLTPAVALALLLAFAGFPPLENPVTPTFGLFDTAVRHVLSNFWRVELYWVLATLAVVRYLREPLPLLLVGANAMVLTGANFGWEKYAVPTLVVLWYLKSREMVATEKLELRT